MSSKTVVIVLVAIFVVAGGLNVYVASALRSRAPGLARRGYFSAAAFAVGAISIVARAMGYKTLSLALIGVMIVLFLIGIFQKGVLPKS
ncbi:hypothetical protein EPN44_09080 [bacterium]|nr:MAG: hypothetical protein EPN44_09080 [bacterium]